MQDTRLACPVCGQRPRGKSRLTRIAGGTLAALIIAAAGLALVGVIVALARWIVG